VAASAGFGLLASDVTAGPAGALRPLDVGVHLAVAAGMSPQLHLLADKVLSDAPIVVASVGWVAATALSLFRSPVLLRRLGVASYVAALRCSLPGSGEAPLADFLKQAFRRARPSSEHHSWSFPSAHTLEATVLAAGFL
jgi:membrane-associated phospholipid phosphatase